MMTQMKIRKVVTKVADVHGLGEKIKQARMSLPRDGKSLEDLCDEVGFSRTYWYSIEKGSVKTLSIETLQKIEKALGVDFGVKFD